MKLACPMEVSFLADPLFIVFLFYFFFLSAATHGIEKVLWRWCLNRTLPTHILRIVPLPVLLLLIVEVFYLTLIILGFLGLTELGCPSTLHLIFLLVLLPLLKGSMSRRRPSHNIHRLLLELVIFLKVL